MAKRPESRMEAVSNNGNVADDDLDLIGIRKMVQKHEEMFDRLDEILAQLSDVPLLKVKRLHPDAVLPTRGTPGSAGLDLYAIEDVEIQPDGIGEMHTGLAMEIPPGYFGLFLTRSSTGKKMVRLSAGANAADEDYRGELMVYLTNDGIYPWPVHKGDRVAQIVITPYLPCVVREVDELSETQRGAGGFGSTGR